MPPKISDKAIERGYNQIGTLGSGNHYLEIQVARPENIFDQKRHGPSASPCPNQIVIMFHCGSRGFGHQVATDYLQTFLSVMETEIRHQDNWTGNWHVHRFIPGKDRTISRQ